MIIVLFLFLVWHFDKLMMMNIISAFAFVTDIIRGMLIYMHNYSHVVPSVHDVSTAVMTVT